MKFLRKTVIFSGGLGNQLFQFAFLHNLCKYNDAVIDLYFPFQEDGSRPFNLQKLVENCAHIRNVRLRSSRRIDLYIRIDDFLSHRFPKSFIRRMWVKTFREENAYSYSLPTSNSSYFSGYFQNWKYVFASIDVVEAELNSTLKAFPSDTLNSLLDSEYGVVHFRRGDLLQFSGTMGVLTSSYFRNAISEATRHLEKSPRIVIISDDRDLALREFSDISSYVCGPKELSEWEALAVMSKAAFVITSNSTFSWWGGVLSTRNGGTAYIPDPWFLDWNPKPLDAFQFPNFKLIPSVFE